MPARRMGWDTLRRVVRGVESIWTGEVDDGAIVINGHRGFEELSLLQSLKLWQCSKNYTKCQDAGNSPVQSMIENVCVGSELRES